MKRVMENILGREQHEQGSGSREISDCQLLSIFLFGLQSSRNHMLQVCI